MNIIKIKQDALTSMGTAHSYMVHKKTNETTALLMEHCLLDNTTHPHSTTV